MVHIGVCAYRHARLLSRERGIHASRQESTSRRPAATCGASCAFAVICTWPGSSLHVCLEVCLQVCVSATRVESASVCGVCREPRVRYGAASSDAIMSSCAAGVPCGVWRVQEARTEKRDTDEVRNLIFDLFRESALWNFKVFFFSPLPVPLSASFPLCFSAAPSLPLSLSLEAQASKMTERLRQRPRHMRKLRDCACKHACACMHAQAATERLPLPLPLFQPRFHACARARTYTHAHAQV